MAYCFHLLKWGKNREKYRRLLRAVCYRLIFTFKVSITLKNRTEFANIRRKINNNFHFNNSPTFIFRSGLEAFLSYGMILYLGVVYRFDFPYTLSSIPGYHAVVLFVDYTFFRF